jgi:hypothetical protein
MMDAEVVKAAAAAGLANTPRPRDVVIKGTLRGVTWHATHVATLMGM